MKARANRQAASPQPADSRALPWRDLLWMAPLNLLLAAILISQVLFPLKGLTGDEPHYLVLTHSIVSDGDLELRDDYNAGEWRAFYNGQTLPPHYAPGLDGQYFTKAIGLSLYLVPFYLTGRALGDVVLWARLGMAAAQAALLAVTYLLCRSLGIGRRASLTAWAFASLTVPLAFYSYSVYPEIPAALLTALALLVMSRWDGRGWVPPLVAGTCLSLLPWMGLKYVGLGAAAGAALLLTILTRSERKLRSAAALCAAPAAGAALLMLFLLVLYGALDPGAIYTGVGEGARVSAGIDHQSSLPRDNPLASFVRIALLYFVDQRDGLLFYSPIYIFGIAGVVLMLGQRPMAVTLTAVFSAHWIVYALSRWTSGHAPPCRPLAAVVWVLVVGMAVAFERSGGRPAAVIKVFTAAAALAFALVLASQSFLLYHDIYGSTAAHGNNLLASIPGGFDLTLLFPNLVNAEDIHPLPTVAAVALAATLVLLLIRGSGGAPCGTRLGRPIGLLVAAVPVFLFGAAYISAEFIPTEKMQGLDKEREKQLPVVLRLAFRDQNTYGFEPVEDKSPFGFWVVGGAAARVDVVCGERPGELVLDVHSPLPQTVELRIEGRRIALEFAGQGWKQVRVPGEHGAAWMHRVLFRLEIKSPLGFNPAGSSDTRYLGCRVAISAVKSGS